MRVLIIWITALQMTGLTMLVSAENNIQYNYLEFRLIADAEVDDFDIDGDGIAFGASIRLDELFYVVADYEATDFDFNIDTTVWQGGIGVILPVNKVDMITELALVHLDTDIEDYDGTGYRLSVGARGYIIPELELRATANRMDVEDLEDTFFTVSGDYFFTPSFSVNLSHDFSADIERLSVGLRYYLGE